MAITTILRPAARARADAPQTHSPAPEVTNAEAANDPAWAAAGPSTLVASPLAHRHIAWTIHRAAEFVAQRPGPAHEAARQLQTLRRAA